SVLRHAGTASPDSGLVSRPHIDVPCPSRASIGGVSPVTNLPGTIGRVTSGAFWVSRGRSKPRFFPSKLGYGFVVALFRASGTVKLPTVARSGRPSYRDRRGPGEELTPVGSLGHRLARTRMPSRPSGASPERRFRLSPLCRLWGAPRPDPARIRTPPERATSTAPSEIPMLAIVHPSCNVTLPRTRSLSHSAAHAFECTTIARSFLDCGRW